MMRRNPSHFMACFCFLAFVYCAKRKLDTCAYMLVAAAFSVLLLLNAQHFLQKSASTNTIRDTVAEEKELPGQRLG